MLVFQYGSNMSSARLNHSDRLNGDSQVISTSSTVEQFDLAFTVWSRSNKCAAADIVPSGTGRSIYGVLYDIPDYLIGRDTAKEEGRKSLDAIENEGTNYRRTSVNVITPTGDLKTAMTYVVLNRTYGLVTSKDYAQHIVDGLYEHIFPEEYRRYVMTQIEINNPGLKGLFDT